MVEPVVKRYQELCGEKLMDHSITNNLLKKYYSSKGHVGNVHLLNISIKELSRLEVDLTEKNIIKQIDSYCLKPLKGKN